MYPRSKDICRCPELRIRGPSTQVKDEIILRIEAVESLNADLAAKAGDDWLLYLAWPVIETDVSLVRKVGINHVPDPVQTVSVNATACEN